MTPHEITVPPTCICGDTLCEIPYGYCHCRCGQKTPISKQNETKRKVRRGEPRQFIANHAGAIKCKKHFDIPDPEHCICGDLECRIPRGKCHCGCEENTKIAHQTLPALKMFKGYPLRFIRGHQRIVRLPLEDAVPFKIDGVYCRLIPLTKGQYTIVDAADYEWLMKWKWHVQWNGATKSFYATRTVLNELKASVTIRMNRQILGLTREDINKGDHISGVTLDNRRGNLRPANAVESACNRGLFVTNKSGYAGVQNHKHANKWRATIRINRVTISLGSFDTLEEAVAVRLAATRKYHGEFARKF